MMEYFAHNNTVGSHAITYTVGAQGCLETYTANVVVASELYPDITPKDVCVNESQQIQTTKFTTAILTALHGVVLRVHIECY
jgi:hypothetical protein